MCKKCIGKIRQSGKEIHPCWAVAGKTLGSLPAAAQPGSKCWLGGRRELVLVLCNLLSLHFGAESHQPGIRGVPTEMILAQPIVTASMFKISDSSEQLGNVKKLRSVWKFVVQKLLLWEINFKMWNDQVIWSFWTKLLDTDIIYNVVSGTAMAEPQLTSGDRR